MYHMPYATCHMPYNLCYRHHLDTTIMCHVQYSICHIQYIICNMQYSIHHIQYIIYHMQYIKLETLRLFPTATAITQKSRGRHLQQCRCRCRILVALRLRPSGCQQNWDTALSATLLQRLAAPFDSLHSLHWTHVRLCPVFKIPHYTCASGVSRGMSSMGHLQSSKAPFGSPMGVNRANSMR